MSHQHIFIHVTNSVENCLRGLPPKTSPPPPPTHSSSGECTTYELQFAHTQPTVQTTLQTYSTENSTDIELESTGFHV